MASKTTWTCDWCGKTCPETDASGRFAPVTNGWALGVDTEFQLRSSHSSSHPPIYLFPDAMREHTKEHSERELCGDCVQALQDAVKNAREIQISKRPKK